MVQGCCLGGVFLSLRELRWTTVLLGILLSFGTLILGNWLYQQYLVKAPLGEALSQRPEIQDWSLQKDSRQTRLIIELGPVDNLQETCKFIHKTTRQYLGDEGIEIVLADQRTPELKAVKYNLQFPLYEAIAQGNFTNLARLVNLEAEQAKLNQHQIFIDENYLYIQLFQDSAYLYEVVPRHPDQPASMFIQGIDDLAKEPDTSR
jgi:hypothetical protein